MSKPKRATKYHRALQKKVERHAEAIVYLVAKGAFETERFNERVVVVADVVNEPRARAIISACGLANADVPEGARGDGLFIGFGEPSQVRAALKNKFYDEWLSVPPPIGHVPLIAIGKGSVDGPASCHIDATYEVHEHGNGTVTVRAAVRGHRIEVTLGSMH